MWSTGCKVCFEFEQEQSMDDKGASLLDEELQELNRRFETGEMRAFGPNQQRILKVQIFFISV